MTDPASYGRLAPGQALVYLHMPKTGGRSVTQLLQKVFGNELCPFKRWPDVVEHQAELADYRALRGHLFASVLDFYDRRPASVAFFRHPVDRAISEYQFILRASEHARHALVREQSLLGYVSRPNNLAVYSRFLGYEPEMGNHRRMTQQVSDSELVELAKARIDQLAVVGITEDFDRHYRLLEEWLGIEATTPVPRVNVAPGSIPDPPDAVVERILEVGWVDMEIYEHARRVATNSSQAV